VATRKQFISEVNKWGAKVEETGTHDGRQIWIDAPDGKQWCSSDAYMLIGYHVKPWAISEVYDDLISRMKEGLDNYVNHDNEY
jgi:hypothetical protein